MQTLPEILAPISPAQFRADYLGKRPLHIPAAAGAPRRPLDWPRLNALLSAQSHWTDANLKLVLNTTPIGREHYCDPHTAGGGAQWRADPAKVQVFVAMGASIIANAVQDVAPELKAMGEVLADEFGGLMGANVYASFQGVAAFGPHYDLSEVFAFHCEGEKVWRLYETRAEEPIAFPAGEEAQVRERFRHEAGSRAQEVRLRPGDMLYIPRGWYHDALAQSAASLHVTFSITPHSGKMALRLLEQVALEDPAFRRYLPEGQALGPHLADLGARLAALMASPRMADALRAEQAALRKPAPFYALPQRGQLTMYRAGAARIALERREEGVVAKVGAAETALPGPLADAAAWLSERPAFADLELYARFPAAGRPALDRLIDALVRAGAFVRA